MRVGVVTFPGSNCDDDALDAVRGLPGVEAVRLWHKARDLGGADVVVLPGGFSYGDYLRAGAIARFSPIMAEVTAHARRGGPVLAICNGFQIACEAGLLPGALLRNQGQRFVSDLARLRVERCDTIFTRAYDPGAILRLPIAHGEGRYVADSDTLERLEQHGRVVFRYVGGDGEHAGAPAAPSGSCNDIAGIVSEHGNVLGLMPHPERAVDPLLGKPDGRPLFESLLGAVRV